MLPIIPEESCSQCNSTTDVRRSPLGDLHCVACVRRDGIDPETWEALPDTYCAECAFDRAEGPCLCDSHRDGDHDGEPVDGCALCAAEETDPCPACGSLADPRYIDGGRTVVCRDCGEVLP